MAKWWWKLLGVLLFFYVLIGGMVTPLSPGLTGVFPTTAIAGETFAIKIMAYNTRFSEAGKNHVWLKNEEGQYLKASNVQVKSNNELQGEFIVPAVISGQSFTLVVYNALDGLPSYRTASMCQRGPATHPLLIIWKGLPMSRAWTW
ncbi:MAG: hypothetical protein IPN29_00095 [Saprospiraceae bacterium]|nr:hypothetical protein [Saprospiraceae bacterium]